MQIASLVPMKSIQIRNVPEATHAELRVRAAKAGVSMSDYLLAEVERIAARPPLADVLERASSRSGGATSEQIVDAIRADRAERDRQWS